MRNLAARILDVMPSLKGDLILRTRKRVRKLRRDLEGRRKRRLKLRKADQPAIDALRAALGLPLQALPLDESAPPPAQVERIAARSGESQRPHIWIVIPAGIQYFRFVESRALAAIEREYRATYVFPHRESPHRIPREPHELPHDDMLFMPIDARRSAVWGLLLEASCAALARRCVSFRIRHEMAQASRGEKAHSFLRKLIRRLIPVFASRPLFGIFRRNVIRALGPDPTLTRSLAEDHPAAILLPSSLLDCITNDVIAAARECAIPTIVLQTSWDNLSSKGIVAMPPDIMGVWGEQSVKHAVDLQGMRRGQCVVVGSPYYEPFFHGPRPSRQEARKALGFPADRPVILFGGSFRKFDEAGLLRRIEEAIDAGRLPKMLIFYRPHPGRLPRQEENFFEFDWKYSVMDEEVAVVYRANLEGKKITQNEFGYSLERLGHIYAAVDLTISPMSSIVLESLLFGLPVLGIGYSDGKNVWGPDKTSQMTHFRELHDLPCVRISHAPADTIDDLSAVLDWASRPETADIAREAARYFVDNGQVRYAQSVLRVLSGAIQAKPKMYESNRTLQRELVTTANALPRQRRDASGQITSGRA
jgi:hypothetical protein